MLHAKIVEFTIMLHTHMNSMYVAKYLKQLGVLHLESILGGGKEESKVSMSSQPSKRGLNGQ